MIKILVSILGCESYEYIKVKETLTNTIENLGGIDKFLNKGETVLLKVNLVMRKKPEEAATSNPVFVRALAEIITEYGCKVIIGDSPGGPFNETLLRSLYKHTGMEEAAKLSGATLNYDTSTVVVENPKGTIQKTLTVGNFITKVDKIISVAVLKAHAMTKITGATKNMFGIIPGTVKAEYHFNCPNPFIFSQCLIDICLYAKPVLSFVDGIIAMEGHGPTGGDPRKLGVVIGSRSPYHADIACAKIINMPVMDTPFLSKIVEFELCKEDMSDIEIVGEDIDRFCVTDFVIPKTSSMHFLGNNPPKFLVDFVNKHIQPKPLFNEEKCIGCGDCALNCPAKIIEMKNRKPSIIDYKDCIRCYCCQELCPKKAVDIKRPLILKILSKL